MTFAETYLQKEQEAIRLAKITLESKFPNVKMKQDSIRFHGPLIEIDAGFSIRFSGNDGEFYEAYVYEQHPQNFQKLKQPFCAVYKQTYNFH